MSIDKRKAELREYIKARENASEGPWNNCYHEKEYLIEYKLQPEGITRFAAIAGYKDNAEFITKAANESALIAEQLLECIEAMNIIAEQGYWSKEADHRKLLDEYCDLMKQALNKIVGEL